MFRAFGRDLENERLLWLSLTDISLKKKSGHLIGAFNKPKPSKISLDVNTWHEPGTSHINAHNTLPRSIFYSFMKVETSSGSENSNTCSQTAHCSQWSWYSNQVLTRFCIFFSVQRFAFQISPKIKDWNYFGKNSSKSVWSVFETASLKFYPWCHIKMNS